MSPKPLGALWSLRASGVIGGHRRRRPRVVVYTGFVMPIVGSLYPGVLSTGTKLPQVPYYGDTWTATRGGVRLSVQPFYQAVVGYVRKNGAGIYDFTIPSGQRTHTAEISVEVASGDYFDVTLSQVGGPPNEGSDLIWLLSGPHVHP